MSQKLPVVTCRELVRVAERIGFALRRQKGSHAIYSRASDNLRVVIPMHPGRDIKLKTLVGIIEDMGLTPDTFRELL
ncbi:MAG: type II toxin-antitoxin system HicA family toxin [Deltaproteobacteria bacterium]|nr:type II toxin-antitoxin system HicA family toxin [Deltaproteobacteria bacterium]